MDKELSQHDLWHAEGKMPVVDRLEDLLARPRSKFPSGGVAPANEVLKYYVRLGESMLSLALSYCPCRRKHQMLSYIISAFCLELLNFCGKYEFLTHVGNHPFYKP